MRISDWSSDVCSSDLFEKAEPAPIRKVGDEPGLIALESAPSPVEGHVLAPTPATFRGDALIWDRLESRSLLWGVPGRRGLRIDRKSVVSGKSGSVRVSLGVRRLIQKKNKNCDKARRST